MLLIDVITRHGVNSIPELELLGNSNSNFGIGIAYLKKVELINLELEVKFATKYIKSTN